MSGNLVVNGQSTASGGTYEKVRINGEATVIGDIECDEFICNGKARIKGNIKANLIRVYGEATFEGIVQTERLKVIGQTTIHQGAVGKKVSIYGQISVDGNFSTDALNLRGDLSVKGDCEAEIFQVKGAFRIDGLLNVGEAEIEPYGNCKAIEIGGEKIIVRKINKNLTFFKWFKFFSPYDAEVITEMMEGDDLELHRASIKIVRANRVKLGRATKIDRVEYRDSLEKHELAVVGEEIQVSA